MSKKQFGNVVSSFKNAVSSSIIRELNGIIQYLNHDANLYIYVYIYICVCVFVCTVYST